MTFCAGIPLKDVRERELWQLAKQLDDFNLGSLGVKNIFHLGELILKDDEDGLKCIDDLRQKYVGGSPGKALLNKLKSSQPLLTIGGFADTSVNLQRGDIANLISAISPDTLLSQLGHNNRSIYEQLIQMLEVQGNRAIANWRDYCDEYQIDERLLSAYTRFDNSQTIDVINLIKMQIEKKNE